MIFQKKKNMIPASKSLEITLSVRDTCTLRKIIGCADITISQLFQNFIEDILNPLKDVNENCHWKKYLTVSSRKTLLQYLSEREIVEFTVGEWEILQMMKQEVYDFEKRKIKCSKKEKEINENKTYIENRQKKFDNIYEEYILWAGKPVNFEEEMDHVISWIYEMEAFNAHILFKKDNVIKIG
jgi:hypothetical protein